MKLRMCLLAFYASVISGAALALEPALWPLTEECETALALSASPTYVREKAGAYVLGKHGYKLVREPANNYVCIVERMSDASLMPQCFDKVGQQSHIPVFLDEGKKMRDGIAWETIKSDRKAGFSNGTYQSAQGHGVVYMASDFNFFVSQDGTRKLKVHPHVMYHAPNRTIQDMNADRDLASQNRGMPIMASEGPLGFMVSFVERATDSTEVNKLCAGQLPEVSEFTPVPPSS